jgi:hypothetical protein
MPATSDPAVSVVVPVFNGAAHLGATLAAIRAQAVALQLIVVDDGSSDGSADIASAHGASGLLLHQPRAGVCAARNRGLAAARAPFVAFVDQDDIWHPQHLQRHLACFAAKPDLGAVVGRYQHWYPGRGDPVDPAACWPAPAHGEAVDNSDPSSPPRLDPDFSGWVYHQFLRDCWALTSATTLCTALVRDAGGFDESLPFGEDWDLWLRLSRVAPMARIAWPPVLYRQHPVQGSRVARPVDWRTRLLLRAAREHGLASADGRHVPQSEFDTLIAQYHRAYGLHQLQYGSRRRALAALLQSLQRRPTDSRSVALLLAALLGWRPPANPDALRDREHAPISPG